MTKNIVNGSYAAPDVSRDLVPVALDRLAKEDPEAVFVTLASETGNKSITFRQYANAINGVAWWLENQIGRSYTNEGLAYLGTGGGDLFYAVLFIAAVKAGYYVSLVVRFVDLNAAYERFKMLFNSPRNSVDAHMNLFVLQKCRTLIIPQPQPPYVAPLLAAYPMRTLQIPSLYEFLNAKAPNYEYKKSFEEARKDLLVALHTSGSTGLPKPITWTLGCAAIVANAYQAPMPDGTAPVSQLYRDDTLFSAMPMFHAAGLTINVLGPIFSQHKLVLPAPGPLLSADGAVSLIKSARATAAILPPSTLEDISKRPDLLKTLTGMNYILAAGGGLTKSAGDVIINETRLLNILGTTEFGAFSQIEVDQEDWAYMHFSPLTGVEFRPYSDDEYEMIVVRDEQLQRYQSCFELFPHLQELSSHDLFSKHPNKPDLWRYCGRSDDVIVFLNGEKTNPVSMEGLISNRPEVRSALVLGQGRSEAGLLVEPSQSSQLSIDERAALIEKLWPTIQEANKQCPAHARVMKSRILFTTPEKPMSRAGKGTVQRKATLASYSAEIDALYSDADNMRDREAFVKLDINNLEQSVLQIITSTSSIAELRAEDDLFSRGMDSLQVIQTVRLLKLGLEYTGVSADGLAPSTVYTHPTVAKLTAAVKLLTQESRITKKADEEARVERMRSMLEKYSPPPNTKEAWTGRRKNSPQVLMLTGTTGALGSYLLEALAAIEWISKIYCLNRSVNSEQQQAQASGSRGLTAKWNSQRVTFLTGDLSKKDLGLGHQLYAEITKKVDLIIHNAWRVDFNLSLESYEPVHVQGIRNLIDLSVKSAGQIGIFFVSSVGAVMNWPAHKEGPVPEEVISDFRVPEAMGYAESKHVSERLLDLANVKCSVPVSICRVGQIAGPVLGPKGMWNKWEWLPSLITSSQHLGIIPESLGNMQNIDWIPIDILSTIITELALRPVAETGPSSCTYHTINPCLTTWDTLLPYVQAEMSMEVKVVPMATWTKRLRASAATSAAKEDIEVNPALKLMDFYEGLLSTEKAPAILETGKTEKMSPTLRALGPVRGEWMIKWMRQWKES